jgi:hypothetical protein
LRLWLGPALIEPKRVNLFHFSYHKCLTVYFARVAGSLFRVSPARRLLKRTLGRPCGYTHFNSLIGDFYESASQYRVCSVNNQSVDFARLGDYRATHFIRDPRDLVVSGYFYHRRGAEQWSRKPASESAWAVVNGTLPARLPAGMSFSEYLASLSEEEGLIAEMEFRKKHFEAMESWDYSNPNCLELRYEEILGNEPSVFRKIFEHYGLDEEEVTEGTKLARQFSSGNLGPDSHVRDASHGQWRKYFTPKVSEAFELRYPTLLRNLDY